MNTMYCTKCGVRTNANYAEDLGTNGVYCARCATELRRRSSPPTSGSNATKPLSKETRWCLNLANFSVGAYGDPKNPVTLFRYWHDQADAGFPGAEENLKFCEELCEQFWKIYQQQEGEHHAT